MVHPSREREAEGALLREVDDNWARKLAGIKADAKEVNKHAIQKGASDGTMFHHKHDFAPTPEQITAGSWRL